MTVGYDPLVWFWVVQRYRFLLKVVINVTVEVRSIPMFYACIRSVGVTLLLMSSEYGFSFSLMSDATLFVFVCETVSVVLTAIARSLFLRVKAQL